MNNGNVLYSSWISRRIVFFFFVFSLTTDFSYSIWLSSIELWSNKNIILCSSLWHNLNCKIISEYKNDKLEKICSKKYHPPAPPPFKKTHPYNILSSPFYNLPYSPYQGRYQTPKRHQMTFWRRSGVLIVN